MDICGDVVERTDLDGNAPAKLPVVSRRRLLCHTAFLVLFCVLLTYLHPALVERHIRDLDTPQTAMIGMARVHVENLNGLLFIAFAGASGVIAFVYWSSRSLCRLSIIPILGILPLYHSCREVADRVESVPAFHDNFTESECELLDFARGVKAGGSPAIPAQVGRFVIVRYEVLNSGAIVLYTGGEFESRPEFWGFVWYPDQSFSEGSAKSVGFPGDVGDNHRVSRLTFDWYLLYHYYGYIKRGWS